MEPDITIRQATQTDILHVHALTQQAYAEYRERLAYSSVWSETAETIAQDLARGIIVLACLHADAIGSIRCHPEAGYMYLHRLAVLPAYRRRGIGRLLVQTIEQFAVDYGFSEIRLEVRATQPENHLFYARLGYTLGAPSLLFPDGSPRSYWMVKHLPPLNNPT